MARTAKPKPEKVVMMTCTHDPIWANRDTGEVFVGLCPPLWDRGDGVPSEQFRILFAGLMNGAADIVHSRWMRYKLTAYDFNRAVDEESGWECLYPGKDGLGYEPYKPGLVTKVMADGTRKDVFPGKRTVMRRHVYNQYWRRDEKPKAELVATPGNPFSFQSAEAPGPNCWEFRCLEDWEHRYMHSLWLDGWAVCDPPFHEGAIMTAMLTGTNLKQTNKVPRKTSPRTKNVEGQQP